MNNVSASNDLPQPDAAETGTAAPATEAPAKHSPARRAKSAVKSTTKPAKPKLASAAGKSVAKVAAKASAEAPKVAKTAKGGKADKIAKPKKAKLVRDSFTMPEPEYELIASVKKRCVANGLAVKKSEVLRAAIIAFAALSDEAVAAALQALEFIKTGRPAKG